MKRIISLLIIVILLISQVVAAAPLAVSVMLNDQYLLSDDPHLLMDGRVYVVARVVAEALGADVTWVEETKEAHFKKDDTHLIFGADKAWSQRIDTAIPIEGKTFFKDGRLYVPVRVFSEHLGCQVSWDNRTMTVIMTKADVVVPQALIGEPVIDANDLEWLARIVNYEARGGSVLKKIAVANVVLNRVQHPVFPNSVYGVIKQEGQFPIAHSEGFDQTQPNDESYEAARRALLGENNVETCLYFNNRPFSWKDQSDFYKNIEGDYFYY